MELYKSRQEFQDAVIAVADYYHISPAIVEKDYFVSIVLMNLQKYIPGVLFKGGTSLSKCFKIIERFSEDIDITLDETHFTQSNKRKANKAVIDICDELGFEIQNREQVELHSHGNYNCYNIEYPVTFSDYGVKPFIKLEMTFIQKAYPDTTKPVTSLIGEYLIAIGQEAVLPQYELTSFDMKVQSLERTFVDKVFALCDYYIRGEVLRQSRHIYDINKLMKVIDWESLGDLVHDVRNDRMLNKTCVSAQPGVSIPTTLKEIIDTRYFEKDYEEVTSALLNEKVKYETAVESLEIIAGSTLFTISTHS